MLLIVGLGNPGSNYAKNRHNIGFLAADRLAEKYGAAPWVKKFQGEICEVQGSGGRGQGSESLSPAPRPPIPKTYLLKPQTFMNLSGESVAATARFYKIPPENIIVLYDELDLPTGKLRVKKGGGNGGHNGIRSIDAHLGKDYWRVRIGIGRPEHKDDVTNYVLGDFSKTEWQVQEKMLDAIATHFPLLASGDDAGFMNKIALEVRGQGSGLRDQKEKNQ